MLRGFLNALEPLEETDSQVFNSFLTCSWDCYGRSALLWQCVKQLQRQQEEGRSRNFYRYDKVEKMGCFEFFFLYFGSLALSSCTLSYLPFDCWPRWSIKSCPPKKWSIKSCSPKNHQCFARRPGRESGGSSRRCQRCILAQRSSKGELKQIKRQSEQNWFKLKLIVGKLVKCHFQVGGENALKEAAEVGKKYFKRLCNYHPHSPA